MFFVDLVFLLGLSQDACLVSLCHALIRAAQISAYSRIQLCRCLLLAAHDLAVIHWISLLTLHLHPSLLWTLMGFTLPINFNRVRFKSTIALRIISLRWFPATLFKQLLNGVIPAANPHTFAFLDANDYHRIRVTQRSQAVIRSCLHNTTVSPT